MLGADKAYQRQQYSSLEDGEVRDDDEEEFEDLTNVNK